MHIKSQKIADLTNAYAVTLLYTTKEIFGVAAPSTPGECICFPLSDPKSVETVWTGEGGTMSLSQYNDKGDFLATRNFFKGFQCKTAHIVKVSGNLGSRVIERYLDLPFLHRFEVIQVGETKYLLGATLCEDKDSRDDWSKPGKVYLGRIPSDGELFTWKPIIEGLTKNHGFYLGEHRGRRIVLIGSSNGLIEITIPESEDGDWTWKTLITNEVSDSCLVDLDGDGEKEIVTIEGFHGNTMYVYKLIDGEYQRVYEFPVNFGHALWGGCVLGRNGFFMAYRNANGPLIWFQKKPGKDYKMEQTYIDENVGPANFVVHNEEKNCIILAACGESHEVKLYTIT